jgi:hypothetical protein
VSLFTDDCVKAADVLTLNKMDSHSWLLTTVNDVQGISSNEHLKFIPQ